MALEIMGALVPVGFDDPVFVLNHGNELEELKKMQDFGLVNSFNSSSIQLTPLENIDIRICEDGIVLVFICKQVNARDSIAIPFSISLKQIELSKDPDCFLTLLNEKLEYLRRALV